VIRILATGAIALALTGCGKAPDAPGPLAATRQFFEIDNPVPSGSSGPAAVSAHDTTPSPGQAISQFFELGAPASSGSGQPGSPMSRSRPGARSEEAADINGLTEQLRNVFSEASAYLEGFPQAEDTFRHVPTRFQDQVDKVRENQRKAPEDVVRRRIVELAPLALEAIEHQHERYETLRDTYNQRYNDLVKRSAAFEQTCTKLSARADTEQAQACNRFLDAMTMVKTKGQLIDAGFAHLEDVYKETREAQTKLNNETLAAK
jgi:hypothetical protein